MLSNTSTDRHVSQNLLKPETGTQNQPITVSSDTEERKAKYDELPALKRKLSNGENADVSVNAFVDGLGDVVVTQNSASVGSKKKRKVDIVSPGSAFDHETSSDKSLP